MKSRHFFKPSRGNWAKKFTRAHYVFPPWTYAREPKRVGRAEKWCLGTRQGPSHFLRDHPRGWGCNLLLSCTRFFHHICYHLASWSFIIIIRSKFFFLFIGREPTTWPANSCLYTNNGLLIRNVVQLCQTIFGSCVKETTLFSFMWFFVNLSSRKVKIMFLTLHDSTAKTGGWGETKKIVLMFHSLPYFSDLPILAIGLATT